MDRETGDCDVVEPGPFGVPYEDDKVVVYYTEAPTFAYSVSTSVMYVHVCVVICTVGVSFLHLSHLCIGIYSGYILCTSGWG